MQNGVVLDERKVAIQWLSIILGNVRKFGRNNKMDRCICHPLDCASASEHLIDPLFFCCSWYLNEAAKSIPSADKINLAPRQSFHLPWFFVYGCMQQQFAPSRLLFVELLVYQHLQLDGSNSRVFYVHNSSAF